MSFEGGQSFSGEDSRERQVKEHFKHIKGKVNQLWKIATMKVISIVS